VEENKKEECCCGGEHKCNCEHESEAKDCGCGGEGTECGCHGGNGSCDCNHEEPVKEKKPKDKYKVIIQNQNQEIKTLKEQVARIQADADNYKKRVKLETEEQKKYSIAYFATDLLDPLDQLSKVVNMSTDNDLLKNFLLGFKMINDKIFDALLAHGIKKIDTKDKMFDPKYHSAFEKVKDESKEEGVIISEVSAGYTLKDRVIKHALVKVNSLKEI
jgi:molecular chaperone GrpE